jgi:hypothetical protein
MIANRNRSTVALAALGMTWLTVAAARGDDRSDVSFSIGYAKLWLDGSGPPFDKQDGVRTEIRGSFSPADELPQLRLGFALGFSGFTQDIPDGEVIIIDDDDVFVVQTDDFETISFIVPEFQASWKQPIGDDEAFFIEPGVALGVVIGYFTVGDWWWGYEVAEWDANVAVRPFIRAGFQAEDFLLGLEASYLWGGDLHFTEDIHGLPNELYVGFFFGGRF